jgi:hypothetical protein
MKIRQKPKQTSLIQTIVTMLQSDLKCGKTTLEFLAANMIEIKALLNAAILMRELSISKVDTRLTALIGKKNLSLILSPMTRIP